eukprot:CAMPEP_0116079488 /NCGR_PEP_ID=MMETSP0327-20121206/1168_1 /TAXON_ID=44447 /ORGANISM="Pseudo-nitzschia delicatissima, Strain B596" /LENGTH=304 /DNA_ID=CAMNT_0003570115 /DNA_START=146 /DNA_END=1060 /DNA_ORIENTATION=+
MCRPNSRGSTAAGQNPSLFMLSTKSFDGHGGVPRASAQFFTAAVFILFLIAVEQMLRHYFTSIQDIHPILGDETNRNILARHVGVDAFSAFVVTYFGWKGRHVVQDLIDATIGGKKGAMPVAYEGRMFTYHPESQRVVLYFVAYQLKNTYDTIIWNDGALFIAHHILALCTTVGALQGKGHFYVLFYFGISELSTGVLCLLANFDDEHGVVGLGVAFPLVKVILGGIFAALFVICRAVMWSTISYYYCRDAWNVLKGSDPRKKGHELWFRYTFFSLSILSLLQIIWLGEIARVGHEELKGMGFI